VTCSKSDSTENVCGWQDQGLIGAEAGIIFLTATSRKKSTSFLPKMYRRLFPCSEAQRHSVPKTRTPRALATYLYSLHVFTL
jgi:hypothetical protein